MSREYTFGGERVDTRDQQSQIIEPRQRTYAGWRECDNPMQGMDGLLGRQCLVRYGSRLPKFRFRTLVALPRLHQSSLDFYLTPDGLHIEVVRRTHQFRGHQAIHQRRRRKLPH